MKNSAIKETTEIVNDYLEVVYNRRNGNSIDMIYLAFQKLLNGSYDKYNIKNHNELGKPEGPSITDLQKKLSKVNELSQNRKQFGVYYTPKDVTSYIIVNSFLNYIFPNNSKMFSYEDGCQQLLDRPMELKDLIFSKVVFDPTSGAGEFLINAFKIKIRLLSKIKDDVTDEDYLSILSTIKGNDIDEDSTDICKIRMLIEVSNYIPDERIVEAAKILNSNFTNQDFVIVDEKKITRSDIILGNPPYVEYSKVEIRPSNNFGNIYADVVKNSILSLKRNGVFGLVVPLSYVSTSRMQKIRNFVEENTKKQFILSFADRPDCLFTGVHQKLCLIFGVKSKATHSIYTSNYKHWYKSERKKLLNGCSITENSFRHDGFIPKIGNEIENSIFRKIFTSTDDNIYQMSKNYNNTKSVFLNMRATFYIKAFSFNPGSKEYKEFEFNEDHHGFIMSLLNSSLYFLFWSIVSDCWHITTKELKHMHVPNVEIEVQKFNRLAKNLEEKLEETKKYIGTKQTDYEYKHKECFAEIDEIDNALASIYDLTQEELNYVKTFAKKYRVGTDI